MKRFTANLLGATVLFSLGYVVYWFSAVWKHREFRVGDDLHRALAVLGHVQLGESRCYKATGHFAALDELGPKGCGGLERGLSAGTEDGFTVQVHAEKDRYSVKVHPANLSRLHSLYLDPAGNIHFGTRDWPATAESPLLVRRWDELH